MSMKRNENILTFIAQEFNLEMSEVAEAMKKLNEENLIKKHPFEIWQGTNGSWYTYFPDSSKGRKLCRKSTRTKLIEALQDFYLSGQNSPTVGEVFDRWIRGKIEASEIQKGSADRYETDFTRFFCNSGFADRKIKFVTEADLENFIRNQIAIHALSQKTFAGLRILINGIWKLAKKEGLTSISITQFMGDLALSRNIFCKKVVERENEIFSEDELPCLTAFLTREDASIWDLGVALTLETGLRVGELAALQKEDWDGQYVLKVRRSESRYKDENGKCTVTVKNFTKTDAGMRDVLLSTQAQTILERVIESTSTNGKFMFENQNGKRIRANTFNKHLDTVLRRLGMHHRSIHKARKTYGTRLIDGGCEDSLTMQQLGHTSVETTRKYYYFANQTRKHQLEQVQKALEKCNHM